MKEKLIEASVLSFHNHVVVILTENYSVNYLSVTSVNSSTNTVDFLVDFVFEERLFLVWFSPVIIVQGLHDGDRIYHELPPEGQFVLRR
uniref:CSON010490 protein n=1 Tax=Culicoides sonorensis TaxID=179676 RepID=A0A336LF02_CULSO